jgi:uncharacterized membrane protein required for colicin V production
MLSAMGDLLSLVIDLENPLTAPTASYAIVFFLYLLSTALLLLGLVGFYTSQSRAEGTLGLVGFLVAFLGTVLLVGALWFELLITPALAEQAPDVAGEELGLTGFILMLLVGAVG